LIKQEIAFMPEESTAPPSLYLQDLGTVVRTVYQDRKPIVAITVLLVLAGFLAGLSTRSTQSTAQLVLTPLPLRDATTTDKLAMMLAGPMDVTTASLLCESDEAFERTRQKLNESGMLDAPIEDLWKLKNNLSLEITVALETPYATEYSPIISLTAESGDPEMAKLMVDTWAETVVELAEKYRSVRQGPPVSAFAQETTALEERLDDFELEVEAFWSENAVELYNRRANFLIGGINEIKDSQVRISHEINRERARLEILARALEDEEPVRRLRWIPSGRLANLVADVVAPGETGDPADGDMLVREEVNPLYMSLHTEQVMGEANLRGQEAELEKLEETLADYEAELLELQALTAHVLRVEKRMTREVNVIEDAFMSAAAKLQFAEIAGRLQHPPVQVLSYGAEWRVPRFRRGILFGFAGGVVGVLLAGGASVATRRILEPALAASQ